MKKKPRAIYPDGYWKFVADAGKVYKDGKAWWPAGLNVTVNRYTAGQLLIQLANFVTNSTHDETTLMFSGTLERLEDE